MAERKVNSELPLSVMLTGKCRIDSLVDSALRIYQWLSDKFNSSLSAKYEHAQNHSNLVKCKEK